MCLKRFGAKTPLPLDSPAVAVFAAQMTTFRTTADIVRFSVLLLTAISTLQFTSAAQLSSASAMTIPLLADHQVKAHHELAADGSTSAAWALRKYYAIVKKDFAKSAEWAQFAYFRQVKLDKEAHEKTRAANEAPYVPFPVPLQFKIQADLIEAYEEAAYAGDQEAILQLKLHYGTVLNNRKLSEYWATIGMLYGIDCCVSEFWVYIDNAETDNERQHKIRLVKTVWNKFNEKWSQKDRMEISKKYEEYGLQLD